jgi:hypothetical protein
MMTCGTDDSRPILIRWRLAKQHWTKSSPVWRLQKGVAKEMAMLNNAIRKAPVTNTAQMTTHTAPRTELHANSSPTSVRTILQQ